MLMKAPAYVSVSFILLEVLLLHLVAQSQAQATTSPNEGHLLSSFSLLRQFSCLFIIFFPDNSESIECIICKMADICKSKSMEYKRRAVQWSRH